MSNYQKQLEIENILPNLRESPLFVSVFQIASIWIIANLGYEMVKNFFGGNLSYSQNPLSITIYYIFWILITLFAFWNVYIKWDIVKNELVSYLIAILLIGFIVTYVIYLMPIFPTISWDMNWKPPAEIVFASGWYFLPKSAEIILQQLLVSALALSFLNSKISIKATCLWCAGLFGITHILLIVSSPSILYVTLFTFIATIAGFIFPYLILKVRNGFMYSYMLHWSFYAILIFIAHTFFKI